MSEVQLYKKGLEYVKKMHKGQFRAGKAPVWQHLLRVSQILKFSLEKTGEGTPKEKFNIYFSALGHDLIEDTAAEREEILKIFGSKGLELIEGMTNSWGDQEKVLYIKKVCASEEGVRLIKLADLIDNYSSVAYNINLLGIKWTESFFLPIVTPMNAAIIKTKFIKFKKTAHFLIEILKIATKNLEVELKEIDK